MTTATIYPSNFPIHYHPSTYPAWFMGKLWEQGIKFTPGLPTLGFSTVDVLIRIAPPWRMDRSDDDGVITVRQGET